MPKEKTKESVVYDWVSTLTFQMQALLMTGMRGPDNSLKHSNAKAIVRYLRGIVLKPAGKVTWGENDNDFMWTDYLVFETFCKDFWGNHDHYAHHFIMHLLHCAEVVGYMHPEGTYRRAWISFYWMGCESFHMKPESKEEMEQRLNDFTE